MADILKLEKDIKVIIDELKGVCNTIGLSNSAEEESVITSVFLYKFLNDRFMWNLEQFSIEYKRSKEDILANRTLYVDSKTSRAHPRELFSFIIGYKIDQVDQVDENSEQSSSLQASFALAMWWTS